MRSHALSLLVFWLIPVALATFVDDAYQNDWHHSLLGTPQSHTTFFHQPSVASKASLIYTLSEKNVVAAINPKDGEIVWRQYLGNGTQAFLKAGKGEDTVISAIGQTVRAWDAADGKLVWEWIGGNIKGLEILEMEGNAKDVLVLQDQKLTRLGASNGEVVWAYADTDSQARAVAVSATKIFYIWSHSTMLSSKIDVTALDPTPIKPDTHSLTGDSGNLQVGDNPVAPILMWTESSPKAVKISVIGSRQVETIKVDKEVEEVILHAPRNAQPHFLIHYQASDSHWAEVYHTDIAHGTVSKAYDIPRVGGKGAFSTSTVDANVYFIRHTETEVILFSSASHGILERWPISCDVIHATSEVAPKGKGFAVRSALTLTSGDWELIRNGEHVWQRSESLAGIVAAAFAEIPVEETLAKELAGEIQKDPLSAYVHRVKRHLNDLQHFPDYISRLPTRIIGVFLGDKPAASELERDGFGFRKIVIIATKKGRVIALDTGAQGRVLWNVEAVKSDEWLVKIVVEGQVAHVEDFYFDVMTGASLTPPKVAMIAINDVHVPENIGATVVVTRGAGSVRGWSVEDSTFPVWQFLPPPGETISAIIHRPAHDPVASIGKALGDRNVLYKYLNQNLVIISTITASTLSIYLLDSITGQQLYTIAHSGVDTNKPTPITFSENWFAYSLYSDPTFSDPLLSVDPLIDPLPKGYQLVVSEMYESPLVNDRGPLGSSQNFSSLSASLSLPHVLSQSYIIPGPISHMSTTSTLQGITPRSLLCILPSSLSATVTALLSIPIPFLSPRRPINRDPLPAEAEEGLFKYNPFLDFNPHWILNHQREVLGLKEVISSPTLMESTSLVLAYGDMDIFGTRVAPIGVFDVLGKAFNKLQLIATVLALGVGTAILGPMVRKKQVDTVWKIAQ
ncbi:MAG: hypothetical protein MMC33_002784 [Icmadophila ericetorum]|nr:hypothetical protein [Icmadophila ericetorum]